MPYQWLPPDGETRRLRLWPHHSLNQKGFVWFIGSTAALIALPLTAVIGSAALWVLLPFIVLAVGGIWYALRRNAKDRQILEALDLSTALIRLHRTGPDGEQHWEANPYWVRPILHDGDRPVPKYLTLTGRGTREVELGAFLSPEEREALHDELLSALRQVNGT